MFQYFKQRNAIKRKAQVLYKQAVAQARMPIFYENLEVPDTVDGRFEMIALHCYIIMNRLNKGGEVKTSQALFDVFFVNMDRSLREIGVGDLSVPKHMKRMMQGFHGRRANYERAIEGKNAPGLKSALVRNVYGTTQAPSDEALSVMIDYIEQAVDMTESFPDVGIIKITEEKSA